MKKFSDAVAAKEQATDSSAAAADLSSLLNYPALGRLFDGTDPHPLARMQEKLRRTHGELERVVRQGNKDDAARAARAVRAYDTTLAFLEDLERLRRESSK